VLIVCGSFEVEEDQRGTFIADRHEAMATSRAEAGCFDYVMSADPIDPGRVVLFERWENQEALDAHLVRIRAVPPPAGGGVTPLSASIKIFDIAGERPLG
jgi:quinol monooxygenase YgiN